MICRRSVGFLSVSFIVLYQYFCCLFDELNVTVVLNALKHIDRAIFSYGLSLFGPLFAE